MAGEIGGHDLKVVFELRSNRRKVVSCEAESLWEESSEAVDENIKKVRILVCGPAGVGKSSLLNLVLGVPGLVGPRSVCPNGSVVELMLNSRRRAQVTMGCMISTKASRPMESSTRYTIRVASRLVHRQRWMLSRISFVKGPLVVICLNACMRSGEYFDRL